MEYASTRVYAILSGGRLMCLKKRELFFLASPIFVVTAVRNTKRSFPAKFQKLLIKLNYVPSFNDLPSRILEVEDEFQQAVKQVKEKTKL